MTELGEQAKAIRKALREIGFVGVDEFIDKAARSVPASQASEKSLMKQAADLGMSFSAAKILYDMGFGAGLDSYRASVPASPSLREAAREIFREPEADEMPEGGLVYVPRRKIDSLRAALDREEGPRDTRAIPAPVGEEPKKRKRESPRKCSKCGKRLSLVRGYGYFCGWCKGKTILGAGGK